MKPGKALILSALVTLLVSIGVIVFNNTYASSDPAPAPAAAQADPGLKDQLVQLTTDDFVEPVSPAGDDGEIEAWDDDDHEDDEEDDDEHEEWDEEDDDDD